MGNETPRLPADGYLDSHPGFDLKERPTALARALAVALTSYRADHELTQRDLGQRLGMKQPQVARIELAQINPSMETLMRVTAQLGIEFTIEIRRTGSVGPDTARFASQLDVLGVSPAERSALIVSTR